MIADPPMSSEGLSSLLQHLFRKPVTEILAAPDAVQALRDFLKADREARNPERRGRGAA